MEIVEFLIIVWAACGAYGWIQQHRYFREVGLKANLLDYAVLFPSLIIGPVTILLNFFWEIK